MILVVDASVIVKWFFRDPAIEKHAEHTLLVPQSVRAGTVEILRPPHWLAEVAAVIARLEPGPADDAMDALDAMELPVAADVAVYKRATLLSVALRQHHDLPAADDGNFLGDARGDDECRRFGVLRDAAVFHAGINDPDGW